jgi:uncharacterized membrane protein
MKSPFRQILLGGIRVAKTLTTWSVILGFLFAWDYSLGLNLYKIWNEQGWNIAQRSHEFAWFFPITVIIVGLFGLFVVTERKQNAKTEETNKEIISKLDNIAVALNALLKAVNENTEALKRINLTAVNPSHNRESDTRPDNQSHDDTK